MISNVAGRSEPFTYTRACSPAAISAWSGISKSPSGRASTVARQQAYSPLGVMAYRSASPSRSAVTDAPSDPSATSGFMLTTVYFPLPPTHRAGTAIVPPA